MMQDYEKALAYYEKALEEVKLHFWENMSYAILCENCAAVCEQLGNEERKVFYLNKSRQVKDAIRG